MIRRLAAFALLFALNSANAESLSYCVRAVSASAEKVDRMLLLGNAVEEILESSHANAAIISRSGFDLRRFNLRYSHSGVALPRNTDHTWFVRQLYFDCKESRPRIFDQGIAGFSLTDEADRPSFVSLVFLPQPQEILLEGRASNNRLAVALLGAQYSANAYAFSTAYQNCNQWVIELLAYALGNLNFALSTDESRSRAQTWLEANGYEATSIHVDSALLALIGGLLPFVHRDDHPPEVVRARGYQVSMPSSIESFARRTMPGASRVELCLTAGQIVVRRGWLPIDDACSAGEGDEVLKLPLPLRP